MDKWKFETPKVVLEAVSAVTEINKNDILSKNKTASVVNAKRIAIAILYQNGYKAKNIALFFNINRKHVYACVTRQLQLNQLYTSDENVFLECKRRCINEK